MSDVRRRPLDHWVVIPDADLAYILDGPARADLVEDWVESVQEIIADGLETV